MVNKSRNKFKFLVILFMLIVSTVILPACSSSNNAKEDSASEKQSETMAADVVVVGSGMTGLTASIQASELGLDVIMLEKNAFVGGTTNVAEGYGGINTDFAKKQGVQYDVKEVFEDAQDFHHWTTDQELLLKFYEESGETGNWLESQGAKFTELVPNGTNKFNTWHYYENGEGTQVVKALADRGKELGVKTLLQTSGKELIMKDGKVAGIKAKQKDGSILTIEAPVVILATGGYAGNPEMLEKYTRVDPKIIADKGIPGRTGDGINMALKVGASDKRLKGTLMNFGASMNSQGVYDPVNLVGWLPLLKINQEGVRYIDESVILSDWGTNGNAQKQQGIVYHIVTKDTLDKFVNEGFPGYWPDIPNFNEELEKALENDKEHVFVADTIEELAKQINVDKTQLVETVDKYNGYSKNGKDLEFGKPAEFLYPVDKGPYYAFKFELGIFATTDGLEVTTDAQVLDKEGKVIPGLYAGGSDAGGLNGETYDVNVVPGSQQGWAANSGRFAAKDAARYIEQLKK